MSRILKWPVKLDDQWHEIGLGSVALVDPGPVIDTDGHSLEETALYVWTIEPNQPRKQIPAEKRLARVYGTDHLYPNYAIHLGSCVVDSGVWHVVALYELQVKATKSLA